MDFEKTPEYPIMGYRQIDQSNPFFTITVMGKLIGLVGVVVIVVVGYMVLKNDTAPSTNTVSQTERKSVKEFTTTAYYDDTGVWYSLKEMRVKKGDTVRLKATTTKGAHDFSLDEFGIKRELPLNEEVIIEFVADKTGEFTYYCSKTGHRAKGQFGKLIVE